MARNKAAPAIAPVKETTGSRFSKVVAQGKDFGNNVAARVKVAGTSAQVAGKKAAAHVSRNKAAYIAGGLGAAAGVAGGMASRKKRTEGDG